MLIVEDRKSLRIILRQALEQAGFEVTEVHTVGAAKDLLRREDFDLLTLDMQLPDSTREETVKLIPVWSPSVPIIVITGTGDPDFVTEVFDQGASGYLSKDCNLVEQLPSLARGALAGTRLHRAFHPAAA